MDSLKTIGFKIVNNGNVEFYKFSIPPESMSIKQPQRINRIKTFGGVVEEDYGLDNPIITISGTMAGKRKRQVKSTFGKLADGYDEMMLLYNHFVKYKEKKPNYQDVKIYFYDFSQEHETNYWEVSFDDFTINRDADKPHYYNYDIQLFCIKEKGTSGNKKTDIVSKSKIFKVLEKVRKFKDEINKLVQKINSANIAINKLKNDISEILSAASCLCDIVEAVFSVGENGFSILTTSVSSTMNIAEQYTDLTTSLIQKTTDIATSSCLTFFDIVQFPAKQANKVVKSCLNAKRRLQALPNYFSTDEYDELVQNWHELTCGCSEIAAFGKRVESRTKVTIENANGETYVINNLLSAFVLPGENIQDVAFRCYGDVSKIWLILLFNDLTDLNALEAGTELIIPSSNISMMEGNPVYNDTFSDNFGADICSNFSIKDNDFVLVQGRDNVVQAISLRLNCKKGGNKRNSEYGLPLLHGLSIGEVKNELKEAILSDVRIANINDIQVQIDGDVANYSISTVLIDDIQTTIGGTTR